MAEQVAGRAERAGVSGKTVTLKVKFDNFEQITRSKTSYSYINSREDLLQIGSELLLRELPFNLGVRLLGLTLSNFTPEAKGPVQLTIRF